MNYLRFLRSPFLSAIFLPLLFAGSCGQVLAYDISNQITQSVTRNVSDAIQRNIQYQLIRPELYIRNSAGEIRYLGASPDGKLLAVVMADGSLRVWDTEIGVQRFRVDLSGSPATSVQATPNLVVVGHQDGRLSFRDNQNGAELRSESAHGGAVKALAVSADGGILASAGADGGVKLWKLDGYQILRTLQPPAPAVSLAISADGRKLLTGEATGGSHVWDTETGEELSALAGLEGPVFSVQFANQGAQAALATPMDVGVGEVHTRSAVAEKVPTRGVTAFSGDQAAHIAVVGTDSGQVRMVDLASKSVLREFKPISTAVRHLVYDDARKRIILAGDDGVLRLISADTGVELLQIMMTQAGWAVLDPSGRYDGSEQGLNDVVWRAGVEELPLERFAKFFEPGLLGALSAGAAGGGLRSVPGTVQNGIALPPKLDIQFPAESVDAAVPLVEVRVIAREQGGGIGEVRLYHNGKLTAPGSQYKQEDSEEDDKLVRTLFYRVKPVPGLNTFKAVGSGLYDIEGFSPKVTRSFAGAEPPATLHVLVVGISNYQDSRLNLDYSVADATSVADNLRRVGQGLFQDVREHRLLDSAATSSQILQTLESLEGQAGPNDVVALYLAGHGLVVGDEWRFLPYETRYQSSPGGYAGQGVAASQLYNALVKASPQRMLLLIDSCQSGATTESFRDQERFQRRFLRDVGRTAGVTVLAAARKDQVAAEMSTLKHGLFTYILLSGLEGKADAQPPDGSVTAHELVDYAAKSIPDFSRKYVRYRQEPAAFALGADFRIAGR